MRRATSQSSHNNILDAAIHSSVSRSDAAGHFSDDLLVELVLRAEDDEVIFQSPAAPRPRLPTLALESKSPPLFSIPYAGGVRARKGGNTSDHHPIRPLNLQSQAARSNALRR